MEIKKIVITGGPCAGKTTAKSRIEEELKKYGYTVLFISETATELIESGISPISCNIPKNFQKIYIQLQLEKEKLFEEAAKYMNDKKLLIICDRGVLDSKAYINEDEFKEIINQLGYSEVGLRDRYDAVFHLTTAAKGAEKFYTLENNSARTETIEEARNIDDRLISSWTGHPHLRIIGNEGFDFNEKINKLLSEICLFLGEPLPCEIERKYLIQYPNIELLESLPNCQKVEIIQTYLKSNSNEEVRIRQRGENGQYFYFKTKKRNISSLERIEEERRVSKDEYLELLMETDTEKTPIRKNRYCLTYSNHYFEIDVYPFWNDKAIMEIELSSPDEKINFPDFINIIKEVTDDENYRNSSLAKIKK